MTSLFRRVSMRTHQWAVRIVQMGSRLPYAAAVSVALCVAPSALAQSGEIESRVLARRMADEGATLFEAGKYDDAREMFHRANALYPAPALELWEARSLNKLERLVEAEERYASVKRYRLRPDDSEVVRAAVAEAAAEVDSLRKRIPTLTIQLRGADPTDPAIVVQLAGKALNPQLIGLPIPTDPSTQTVCLISKGSELRREYVELKEGDRKVLELDALVPSAPLNPVVLQPATLDAGPRESRANAPDTRARPWYARRDIGWAIAGLGAASMGVGLATGIVAMDKHHRLVNDCPNNVCTPQYAGELNSYRSYRTVSTIGYVVGAAGLGAGIVILLATPAIPNTTSSLRVGPTSAEYRLGF